MSQDCCNGGERLDLAVETKGRRILKRGANGKVLEGIIQREDITTYKVCLLPSHRDGDSIFPDDYISKSWPPGL